MVTLGKLDSKTLELISWAEIRCYEKSPVIILSDKVYCIVNIENGYFIGEFNSNLEFIRYSKTPLFKDSYIVLQNNIFYIQGTDNNIKLVNLSDFEAVQN